MTTLLLLVRKNHANSKPSAGCDVTCVACRFHGGELPHLTLDNGVLSVCRFIYNINTNKLQGPRPGRSEQDNAINLA
jgi:hypothetical protein